MATYSEKAIWNAIAAILAADATLSAYNNAVYQGVRKVARDGYPFVVMEPARTPEEPATTDRRVILSFHVVISCHLYIHDEDDQIVGNGTKKGILDMVADVKNALMAYPSLNHDGGGARLQHFRFPDTRYDFTFWPYRAAEIDFIGTKITSGAQAR